MTQPPEQRLVVEAKIGVPGTVANNAVRAAAQSIFNEDGTVKAAGAAAAQAAIDARGLLETRNINPEVSTLSYAITDKDGRQLWIQADAAGDPSDFAAERIVAKVGPVLGDQVKADLGVEDMNTEVTGLIYSVVDKDGRRTDLELGEDGHFTPRVVSWLAEQLNLVAPEVPAVADPTRIVIPASLPMFTGLTYKLYYRDFIDALDANHTVIASTSSNGTTYPDRWEFTPSAAKTFNLVLTVVDRVGVAVTSKNIPITVYESAAGAGKRHMAIGDSITRAGNYSGTAATAIGATTVGTRTYNGGALNVEGRGGWTLDNYMVRIGHATYGDSPFLFPVGVSGNKFWGNTNFWKQVCYTAPTAYDFAGFQHIARGWKGTGNPFLYDANGYPVSPGEGDVVVDPTKAAGQTFRQYTAGAWATMNPQPAVEFSFSKFMDRYSAAFAGGVPTSISLMLETNDFFTGIDDASFAAWKGKLDAVIASVRAWSSTVPFVILLAATGGPVEKWSDQNNYNKFTFDRRMRDAGARILAAYDNAATRANNVHVTTFLGAISPANMADWVHPAVPGGHDEMAPYLAGMLAKLNQ